MAPPAQKWFQRLLGVGIVANLALGAFTLFRPEYLFRLLKLPVPEPLFWIRLSSFLLVLLSAFYVPPAIDCRRYWINAWLAVLNRLAGVLFFFSQPPQYWPLGVFYLAFFVPEAILLTLVGRASPSGGGQVSDLRSR